MRASPTRWQVAILATLATWAIEPRSVFAQQTGNNLDVEHYRPPPSPTGMLNIEDTHAQAWREWSVGLYLSYARNPLVLFEERLQVGEVVAHRVSADLVGSIGLLPWLEAYAVLPMTFYQVGDHDLPTGSLAAVGLRDLRLGVKMTLARQNRNGFLGVALVPEVTLPTGDANAFLGSGGVTFDPHLLIDRSFDFLFGLRFAASLGVRFRPASQIGNIDVGNELFYRIGAGVGLPRILDFKPEAIGELAGITGLSKLFSAQEQNPVLGSLGLKVPIDVEMGHQLVATGGVTIGATRGYGAPDFQIFVGVAYRRWLSDRDGDGIFDDDDLCPDDPEDFDGFEDEDGCPDPDNDKDGIPDVADKCPNEPEDIDGFDDIDGCPDPDNDQDGIPDIVDKCPNEPEDFDGFEDEDGCPDPDNDQDGIPDALDKCPNEKETINGVDDEDGCPDEGETHVEVTSEKITIDTRINFDFDSARIRQDSFSILNQVALTILANPQITHLRIEGHTDERGTLEYNLVLSQRRAESVMAYLVKRGVKEDRLEAVGYGKQRPLVQGHGEEVWAKNRRVEFTILDNQDATPAGSTAPKPPGPQTPAPKTPPPAPKPPPKK